MTSLQDAVISRYGPAAWRLLGDDDCSPQVRKKIGYQVAGSDEIIIDMPIQQLMMIMSAASFATGDEECVAAARMVHWIIRKPNLLPMVHCHRGFDLAARCLVSIALFKKAMEWRTRFHGCPAISFYRAAGIRASEESGMEGVAEHFDNWSCFIGETLSG